jgi:hypothetical protein
MAVTRDGIPVRVRCWPGNTIDPVLIRQLPSPVRLMFLFCPEKTSTGTGICNLT